MFAYYFNRRDIFVSPNATIITLCDDYVSDTATNLPSCDSFNRTKSIIKQSVLCFVGKT